MKPKTESDTALPMVIGVDIGKEVFHLVGFGVDGKIVFSICPTADLRGCSSRISRFANLNCQAYAAAKSLGYAGFHWSK